MSESPEIVYGRLLESAHISGYGFERMTDELEWLLEGDRWQKVGPGYDDVNVFLRSIDLSAFNLGEKKRLHKRIKELQPDASSRAIASATGSRDRTVRDHITSGRNRPPEANDTSRDRDGERRGGRNRPPDDRHGQDDEEQRLDGKRVQTQTPEPFQHSARIVANQVRQPVKGSSQLIQQSTENEWYTPTVYVETARRVLGGFDLDPASSHAANEVIKATHIYTADDNGLQHPWRGRLWLNPPYGDLPGQFIAKLIDEHNASNVSEAVALVNAHCTDTGWFQPLWDHTLCFTDHRIDFESAGREKTSTSTHGSVFAYLGPNPQKFADAFSVFGSVVRRWP